MTTSTQHSPNPPTPKQLRLLSRLAEERGVSFATPRDVGAASQQIRRLLATKPSSNVERNEDRRAVRTGFKGSGGATAIRADELDGFGSTTRWAGPDLAAESVLIAIESGHSNFGAIAKAAELDFSAAGAVLRRLEDLGQVRRSSRGAYEIAETRNARL